MRCRVQSKQANLYRLAFLFSAGGAARGEAAGRSYGTEVSAPKLLHRSYGTAVMAPQLWHRSYGTEVMAPQSLPQSYRAEIVAPCANPIILLI